MIVQVIIPKFSIQLPNLVLQIYQIKVSIWQGVTWNLGVGSLWDIFLEFLTFSES